MPHHSDSPEHDRLPNAEEIPAPELEFDQNVAPRPEEEAADDLRAKPDADGNAEHYDHDLNQANQER